MVEGWVSWHATGRDGPFAAACGGYRSTFPGWRGSVVVVAGPAGGWTLTLNDFCANGTRLLDLSDEAFKKVCGPLSMGICRATVETGGTPNLTLPPTDEGIP